MKQYGSSINVCSQIVSSAHIKEIYFLEDALQIFLHAGLFIYAIFF